MIPRRVAGPLASSPGSMVMPGQDQPIAPVVSPEPPSTLTAPVIPVISPQIARLERAEPAPPTPEAPSPSILLAQLQQFISATPNAKATNAAARELLVRRGLAVEAAGFTVVTPKGITYLVDFGLL